MTELEKIIYAKSFIDKLANGIDPLNDEAVPEGEVLNQVRISRCLFFVSGILRQVIDQGGLYTKKAKEGKRPFWIDVQTRERFQYAEQPITVSEITRRINELAVDEGMRKFHYTQILDWLIQSGFLLENLDGEGKKVRMPTATGRDLGISVTQRQTGSRAYSVVVYSQEAQHFILDNLDTMIETDERHSK